MARKSTAKSGRGEESISGYFKGKFAERPELLRRRDNHELYVLWLEDHPEYAEVPLNVKQGLSNIKSSPRPNVRRNTTVPVCGAMARKRACPKTPRTTPTSWPWLTRSPGAAHASNSPPIGVRNCRCRKPAFSLLSSTTRGPGPAGGGAAI